MVEDITVTLGRLALAVRDREPVGIHLTRQRAVDLKQVGVELGVRYALSGSVRKEGTAYASLCNSPTLSMAGKSGATVSTAIQ
jgi:hypothetical protein